MSNYSKEEIAEFKAKDLRISKLAIIKSLIEKSEDIYDVEKITGLTEKYIDYVYEERRDVLECSAKRGSAGCVASSTKAIIFHNEGGLTEQIDWEQIAQGLNLAIPNATNIKILGQVMDEYKKAHKASANPSDILVHILNTFGKYPHNPESVSKIVSSFFER